jgi:N-acetylneuraminic acid mutarotase
MSYNPIGGWTNVSNFPGGGRTDLITAVVDDRYIYFGGGFDNDWTARTEWYYYDTVTSTWSSARAVVPFADIKMAPAITAPDGKIYVLRGLTGRMYSYDHATNTWSATPNGNTITFPPGQRAYSVMTNIGNKVYTGLGRLSGTSYADMWEYDITSNVWTQVQNYPGGTNTRGIALTLGAFVYVGMGQHVGVDQVTWWKLDPSLI